tara:strand:- start:467 stop:592 length:126 start_codon:yes stop_codon:yes gene_type:complete
MEKGIFNIIGLICVLLAYVVVGFEPVCLAILYLLYTKTGHD